MSAEFSFDARILVVDDIEVIRTYIRVMLLKLGFKNVDTASSTRQAQTQLKLNNYDVLFLDINLPDGDGLSLLRWIAGRQPQLCVIMCTANSTIDNVEEAIDYGAKGFLAKPISMRNFVALLRRLGFDVARYGFNSADSHC